MLNWLTRAKNGEDGILLAIKPRFAEMILRQKKSLELRKTCPKFRGPFRVVLYATSPVNRVVGQCVCYRSGIFLTDHYYNGNEWRACVTLEEFDEYFSGAEKGYALYLIGAERFKTPKTLASFGAKRAPQSWQYLRKKTKGKKV